MLRRALTLSWVAVFAGAVACDRTGEPEARQRRAAATTPSAAPSARPSTRLQAVHRITGNAKATDRLPLIVALHGLGDRPESFANLFSGFSLPARFVMLRAPTPYSNGFSWFPFRANASDDERATALRAPAAMVAKEIQALQKQHPTRGRPIVTGFSQGGMLSFTIAAQHAEVVGAAFPVGGLLPKALLPKAPVSKSLAAKRPPKVVALHGHVDPLVSGDAAAEAIAGMKAAGYAAEFEGFSDVGHSISAPMRQRLYALIEAQINPPN